MQQAMQFFELNTAQPATYADAVNAKFYNKASHYVTLEERLYTSINSNAASTLFKSSLEAFSSNQRIRKWNDILLCKADSCSLSEIVIDVTLQRQFDLCHAANILRGFRPLMVMPICVYRDPAQPGKFVCWDGQHTALVLYTIANEILGLDPSEATVPIVIYESSLKSEMRNNFIQLNGDAKQPLDPIDIFHQMVLGVRTDGATYPSWLEAEKKQTLLEQSKMFVTHKKFGDVANPGAMTVLTEINSPHYDTKITEYFCKYFVSLCQSNRPVQPKESWLMYQFFDMCCRVKIQVTDEYIKEIADALNTAFSNNFSANQLCCAAKISYQDWWRKNKPSPDGTLWGIQYDEKRMALTFLLAQLTKNCKPNTSLPEYRYPLWDVPEEDLF